MVPPGIKDVAARARVSVGTVSNVLNRPDIARENDYLDILLEQRVPGVLITPVDHETDRLRMLPGRGVPVVLVDRASHDPTAWCSVAVDDVEGGDLAATHLWELGHRRIAFVGGPHSIPQVADRHRGVLRSLERMGAAADTLVVLETAALNVAEGRRAGQRLVGLPGRHVHRQVEFTPELVVRASSGRRPVRPATWSATGPATGAR